MSEQTPVNEQSKNRSLDEYRKGAGEYLTTDDGHRLNTTDDSLKAGRTRPYIT